MKKELSSGAIMGIVGVVVAIVGGLGYVWMQKASGVAPVSQEQIDREHKATADRYKGMGVGTPADAPPTGTNPEANARSQYPGGK